jgi:hypothetical protein
MDARRALPNLRRCSAWLLWLAFLLPVAQAVAGAHAISHVRTEACQAPIDACAQPSSCDLCLLGAAIAGGAPQGDPPALALPELRDAPPASVAVASPDGRFDPVYRSRAPPSASR